MNSGFSLRLALASNATFSLCCALLMLFRPELVGQWLGIDAPLVLQAIGIGLVVFATDLIHQITRQRIATWRALLTSVLDFSWVAGSFALVVFFPLLFTHTGKLIVIGVAAEVLAFGLWQLWAIGRVHGSGKNGVYRHCVIVESNAPAEKMWQVVSNYGDIKKYMPSLKHSSILDGKSLGVGAIRSCEDHAGKQWAEQCIALNPGHSFAVRFLIEAANFSFPARTMIGGWEVTETTTGSRVMVWWELTPKPALLAPVILSVLGYQFDRDFPKVVKAMALSALGHAPEAQTSANSTVVVRLIPSFC